MPDLLLYADDLEFFGVGPSRRRGIPLSYCFMSLLGFPFKWAKKRGGFRVEWLGMETEYNSYRLGLTKKRAKAGPMKLPVMLRVLMSWLAGRLEGGKRLQRPEVGVQGAIRLVFYTDKAEDGRAWIGGFFEIFPGCQGPWFSLDVEKGWAPWAFVTGDTKKVIAALELLASLIGVRLWVSEGQSKQTTR